MENNMNSDFGQIDLKRMLEIVLDRIVAIIVITILCALFSFVLSEYFITPEYASSITMYVNNQRLSGNNTDTKVLTSDIAASQQLVPTYIEMINSNNILQAVADKYNKKTGETYTVKKLKKIIKAESVNGTEILRVTVENSNAASAKEIANTIADVAPGKIQEFIEKSDVRIIDHATISTSPVSPNVRLNTILGALIGMVVSVSYIFLKELFDVRVKNVEDLVTRFKYPVLGAVPEIFVAFDAGSTSAESDGKDSTNKK